MIGDQGAKKKLESLKRANSSHRRANENRPNDANRQNGKSENERQGHTLEKQTRGIAGTLIKKNKAIRHRQKER